MTSTSGSASTIEALARPGRLLARATLGTGRAWAEASLHALPGGAALLTGVYTTPSLRRQGLSELLILTLLDRADRLRLAVYTYPKPYGRRGPGAEALCAFYRGLGFRQLTQNEWTEEVLVYERRWS